MLNLPTIPTQDIFEYKTNIAFGSLSTPQHTFSQLLFGMPTNYVVCGSCIRLLTSFTGPSLSSLTVSVAAFVPSTILSDLYYYNLSMELTQVVTQSSFQTSGPGNNNLNNVGTGSYAPITGLYFNGAHDVAAYFTSTGTTLDTLTAGVVELTLQIRSL